MAKGRELRGRIRSVENTKKITKTMEMVATSKLKRAQDRVAAARPFATALQQVLADLYSPELAAQFPLLRQPAAPKTAAVLLISTNRGLCGAFNANVLKEARALIRRLEERGLAVELHVVGRKGVGFFRYLGRAIASQETALGDRPSAADAARLVDGLMARFVAGALDEVWVAYGTFKSVLSTPPASDRLLPVAPPARTGPARDYLLSPGADAILGELLPLAVRNAVYRRLVESVAGFFASQRTAMKAATDNATDLLGTLKRTYNRARQAQITQEIAEIVGGASALSG